MEKTAVEWLAEQINGLDTAVSLNYFKQKVDQAKEMEKQQIIEAHGSKLKNSKGTSNFEYWYTGEEYYKKTFENK
jgi:hypothetical protein